MWKLLQEFEPLPLFAILVDYKPQRPKKMEFVLMQKK